jgi:undecaprenyl-diphosphatase
MTIIQAFILGIIQGVTEFLPISSSGHLVIVPYLLGWTIPEEQAFPFDVLVQFSTLFAVLIYYRGDIIQIAKSMIDGVQTKKPFANVESRVGWLTILATIPAGAAGLLLKDTISDAFLNPQLAAISLLFTALILFLAEKIGKKLRQLNKLDWKDATVMGVAQALAVFPGISRSGSTIAGGLLRNLDRKTAGQFAFLMAIPIMSAAGVLSMIDLLSVPNADGFFGVLAVGFITSGVIGFFTISWLLKYISNHKLTPFALYCAILGVGTLSISFLSAPKVLQATETAIDSPITISFNSSAEWIVPAMQTCTDSFPETFPILVKDSETIQDTTSPFIHITYGEMNEKAPYTYQIGTEEVYFVSSVNNPIDSIPDNLLRRVISGEITTYRNLFSECANCASVSEDLESINIWKYPVESPLSIYIQEKAQYKFSSASYIAPTPSHMAQALKTDPAAIGFLPEKMIDQNLKIISPETLLSVPILAYSFEEPDINIHGWLTCLQQEIIQ